MPAPRRYLTTTRFKLGMECPAKLFYAGKDSGQSPVYANSMLHDEFLAALAEGGFQVGELAKQYFPGGTDIRTLDYEESLAQTSALLKETNATIYEAAIRHENLFIRADILVKKGNIIDLIEVKAKSFDSRADSEFIGNRGGIASDWKPYLYDVAFQKHVLTRACPQFKVRAFLMLADKSATCPSDGLHQKFLLVKEPAPVAGGRRRQRVQVKPLTSAEQKHFILCQISVDRECDAIYTQPLKVEQGPTRFIDRIGWLAGHYERDEKIVSQPWLACGSCEFRATAQDKATGLRCGFTECWKAALSWQDKDFELPNVLDIWNYRGKAKLMAERRIAIKDVTQDDIGPASDGKPGKSASERQWLQVEKAQTRDQTPWVEKAALRREMKRWKFPLHFIDFETTRVAIPFNAGRHPYELVAFQYSHHVVHKDGRVGHRGQYLNTDRGVFPNYEFVRRLRDELAADDGSIFRYSTHENSALVAIDRQLAQEGNPPPDRAALRAFIRSITTSTKDSAEHWNGKRTMIDLCEMVKRYYYAPSTNGSNSIKQVLPAILNQSAYLRKKYAQPIYSAPGGIPSLNFRDKQWIRIDDGKVADPYHELPKMFPDVSDHDFERLSEGDELRDGGAAMTAYARMQFEEMSEQEREAIRAALLRYCELDTLAMVMIFEAWRELVDV